MSKRFFQDQNNVKDKVNRANELVKQARMTKGLERIDLVRRAVEINPDCMEAYIILGDEEQDPSSSVNLYRKAVDAGRRRLGRDFFIKNQGKFWQFEEGHSFLIALRTLADKLVNLYSYDEAISYYYQLLQLDINDNQDVRYSLFRLLIRLYRYREARELLDAYQELNDLRWLYNDLLLSYFEQGASKQVHMKARRAITHNEPVCQLLLEPISLIEAHVDIDENDVTDLELAKAVNYLHDHLDLWSSQPEILEWLRQEYYGFNFDSSEQYHKPRQEYDTRCLVRQGNSLIEVGDFIQAEKLLTQALVEKEDPMVRNILGYCKLLMHNYQEALDVLKSGLGNGFLNPFGYTLASECAFYLKDELGAYRYLRHAIRDFDQGMRTSTDLGPFADHWYQYTVIIKAVAGLLGNDRLVINLHRRWDYFVSVEDLYQLGAAYFNCKKYTQAMRIWNQITVPEWGFLDRFEAACHIFKAEIVPAPRLEYLPPWYLMDDVSIDNIDIDHLVSSAAYQVIVIADLFDSINDDDNHDNNVEVLTLSSLGKWGVEFGQAIVAAGCLPYCWKLAAVIGLMNQGIYNYGDQVKINLNDEWTEILIEEKLIKQFTDECLPDFFDSDLISNYLGDT